MPTITNWTDHTCHGDFPRSAKNLHPKVDQLKVGWFFFHSFELTPLPLHDCITKIHLNKVLPSRILNDMMELSLPGKEKEKQIVSFRLQKEWSSFEFQCRMIRGEEYTHICRSIVNQGLGWHDIFQELLFNRFPKEVEIRSDLASLKTWLTYEPMRGVSRLLQDGAIPFIPHNRCMHPKKKNSSHALPLDQRETHLTSITSN